MHSDEVEFAAILTTGSYSEDNINASSTNERCSLSGIVLEKQTLQNISLLASTADPKLSRSQRLRAEFLKKCERTFTIVVDCEFPGMQNTRETTSLCQQLMYSYGINRRSDRPCKYVICGASEQLMKHLERICGSNTWAACIVSSASCSTLLAREKYEKIVYLTADSINDLESIETDTAYIIGGLVDRNKYTGVTQTKAAELGYETARLPIHKFCKLVGSKVLTVNQVFDILTRYYSSQDWKSSIEGGIPSRKLLKLSP